MKDKRGGLDDGKGELSDYNEGLRPGKGEDKGRIGWEGSQMAQQLSAPAMPARGPKVAYCKCATFVLVTPPC